MLSTILILTILLGIFIQDFLYRKVLWILFPILFGLSIWYNWVYLRLNDVLISSLFLACLMITLTIYLTLRMKKMSWFWNGFFSLGDLLMLVAIIPLFNWINYVYFFTFGTILVLVIHLIVQNFSKDKSVPYAGYLSIVTGMYLVFSNDVDLLFSRLNGN